MNLAKSWFYECSSGHHDCPTYAKSKLPTRVIDVGSVQDPSLKLFSSGIGQCDHYVALSYCWGGPQPLMTLSANIHSLSSGFVETQLPQTLADAVTVTRRLGFRYLWVDALCIIQDCEKDKAIEIEKMGSIYKNSALTMVASCARSAREGFLKIRDELDYCKLPFLLPNGKFGMAHVMQETEHYPVAPLDSRGWTLQEWVLSPRKLCYGERELLWYCETEYFKRVTPSSLALVTTSFTSGSMGRGAPGANFHRHNYVPPEGHTRPLQWQYILDGFTARSLSVDDDRPNAVTGIINELKPLWRDECSFGLWHKSFLQGLGWQHFLNACNSDHSTRLKTAPSWSWASRTCAILHNDFKPFNMSWRLDGATLILEAKVLKYEDGLIGEFGPSWAFYWDDPSWGHVQTPKAAGLETYYLLSGIIRPHHIEGIEGYPVCGIILNMQSDGAFERMGLFQSYCFTCIFDDVHAQEVRIL